MPIGEVERRLATSTGGLASDEAAERLRRDGPNALAPPPTPSTILRFVRQFNSPLHLSADRGGRRIAGSWPQNRRGLHRCGAGHQRAHRHHSGRQGSRQSGCAADHDRA
ncbi:MULTISPECIES: cation-transporting P-type ATPase [unclassified Sphingomonas]|uniref:cation-transporting P-type ATPase n=1 Tax=unclassified Sphingomonas TaxID=196159 RepID=UPI003FA7122B